MHAIDTSSKARREAVRRLREQRECNRAAKQGPMHEYAYSPSTFAVGIRPFDWSDWSPPRDRFRVFNVHYPRYRDDDGIGDWVSVGTDDPSPARRAR